MTPRPVIAMLLVVAGAVLAMVAARDSEAILIAGTAVCIGAIAVGVYHSVRHS